MKSSQGSKVSKDLVGISEDTLEESIPPEVLALGPFVNNSSRIRRPKGVRSESRRCYFSLLNSCLQSAFFASSLATAAAAGRATLLKRRGAGRECPVPTHTSACSAAQAGRSAPSPGAISPKFHKHQGSMSPRIQYNALCMEPRNPLDRSDAASVHKPRSVRVKAEGLIAPEAGPCAA